MSSTTRFARDGFVVIDQAYGRQELELIRDVLQANPTEHACVWEKDLCACSSNFLALAKHPRILELVHDLLGDDVILWGGTHLERKPGHEHYWHTDIESSSAGDGFVSVWIGLDGTNRESSLKLVPGSHLFGKTVQEAIAEHHKARTATTDRDIEEWARALSPQGSVVVQPDLKDGDALVFDGRIWHGSNNTNSDVTRRALLFQYARADVPVRIPNFSRLTWPFEFQEHPKPPCIQIRGRSPEGLNRIVEPPPVVAPDSVAIAPMRVTIDLGLQVPPGTVRNSVLLFDGHSPNLRKLRIHYSALEPGTSPHPPHAHVDEEILIVLQGRASLRYADGDGAMADHPVAAGDYVYYPAFHPHTLLNTGEAPVVYLMFKWVGTPTKAAHALGLRRHRVEAIDPAHTATGFQRDVPFSAPTYHLKGLQTHVTTLAPGGGYAAHADEHDVAILVLEGEVETNGQRGCRGDLIYHPAGLDHDMWNRSERPARYLVIEFHGENVDPAGLVFEAPQTPKRLFRKRSPRRILRNIQRLFGIRSRA